ncbi:cell envelope integrity protein CreD [Vibrio sp. Of7-15]|uniref:cell envelope integrity protein CreD n=1 Tax=Vibrio sp. Of7-15 TaxID=2724879 RepID=UPI001EF1686B|nr:cell envelope integrity protein CreD [Vibrio sp. Of7-15]MCG7499215.1 cell envelope integrity protein CreD [Vibrio sp. Of7-15]
MKKWLSNELGTKFGFVLFLFLLLQIPVNMIESLISERSYRMEEVRNDIARSSSGEQRIMGPFISVLYKETISGDERDYKVTRQAFILPERFNLTSELNSFEKYRSIYTARLYQANTQLTGHFDLSDLEDFDPDSIVDVNLVVSVSDSRGLIDIGELKLNKQSISVEPGTGLKQLAQGFHKTLPFHLLDLTKPLQFDFNFMLQGMGQLQVTPMGKSTRVELSSAWPHPSFIGDYLPIASDISESGFKASWATNNFSSNISQLFSLCMSDTSQCHELDGRQMGVSLIDPVDHYLKSHRAVNYSLLVVTLIFASFFLLELFQARPIHPVQYGFVGLALALFYLLLISLSEHIGFNWAYLVSALSSTGLLSVYVAGMLSNNKHGSLFGASLLMLYGLLFGLLQAESYALLMGTLLCFAVLSLVMVLTRNVNWYERRAVAQKANKESDDEQS